MAQELWLSNKQLSQLKYLDAQFIASSGMEDAVSSGVMRGRPFGGVSITWSSDLNHIITPLTDYKHKHVVAIKMSTTSKCVVFICVYMPFLDSRKRDICRTETLETLSMIEQIISDHPDHLFVIGGDLNCELDGGSPLDNYWSSFTTKNKFAYCSGFFGSPGYTYHHKSLNQRKKNDHFIVSEEIYNSSICSDHKINEDGHNPSDHLPILMSMCLEVQTAKQEAQIPLSTPKLRWSKLSP